PDCPGVRARIASICSSVKATSRHQVASVDFFTGTSSMISPYDRPDRRRSRPSSDRSHRDSDSHLLTRSRSETSSSMVGTYGGGCDSSGPVAEVLPGSRRQTAVASQAYGLWRSLVARLLWEQEVVGSSPTSPTTESTRRAGPIKWMPAAGVAQW